MAENMNMSGGSKAWSTLNTILGVGGVATALGVGIPAYFSGNKCGRNGYDNGMDCPISRRESALESEVAMLKAEKSTDQKVLDLYNFTNAKFEATNKQVAENATQIALNKQASDYQFAILDERIKNGDKDVKNWVLMQNYISGKVVLPIDAICPQPLPACVPVSLQGQVVPVEDTTISATVVKK